MPSHTLYLLGAEEFPILRDLELDARAQSRVSDLRLVRNAGRKLVDITGAHRSVEVGLGRSAEIGGQPVLADLAGRPDARVVHPHLQVADEVRVVSVNLEVEDFCASGGHPAQDNVT